MTPDALAALDAPRVRRIAEWQWFNYVDSRGGVAILVFMWGSCSKYGVHHHRSQKAA